MLCLLTYYTTDKMTNSNYTEEIKNAIEEVLSSPQFSSAINSALLGRLGSPQTQNRPTAVPQIVESNVMQTPTRQSMISSRIHEMFPSISSFSRVRHQSASLRSRNRRPVSTASSSNTSFEREVLLVKYKDREETLKRNEKFVAFKYGM